MLRKLHLVFFTEKLILISGGEPLRFINAAATPRVFLWCVRVQSLFFHVTLFHWRGLYIIREMIVWTVSEILMIKYDRLFFTIITLYILEIKSFFYCTVMLFLFYLMNCSRVGVAYCNQMTLNYMFFCNDLGDPCQAN